MFSFIREVGIGGVSWSALFAFRMRVSMSAIGSGQHCVPPTSCSSVMPGITPAWASSRRQMRQSPNFLKTARGRPQRLQREYARTL
jgi:hypothetical protein